MESVEQCDNPVQPDPPVSVITGGLFLTYTEGNT